MKYIDKLNEWKDAGYFRNGVMEKLFSTHFGTQYVYEWIDDDGECKYLDSCWASGKLDILQKFLNDNNINVTRR